MAIIRLPVQAQLAIDLYIATSYRHGERFLEACLQDLKSGANDESDGNSYDLHIASLCLRATVVGRAVWNLLTS
jgi:hypothetical protein